MPTYPYPRPSVTADVVAFTMRQDDLVVLLIRRKSDPFKGSWALPGGFVNENEPLIRAAARELYEETGVSGLKLEQLGAYGDPGRDPRGHTVTVAFLAFVVAEVTPTASDDAAEAAWLPFRSLALTDTKTTSKAKSKKKEPLAFDHARIIRHAHRRLVRHLDDPVRDQAFDIVPPRFTLAELRHLYEVVLGRELTAAMIKKHLVARGLVVPAGAKTPKASAQLYRWNRR